MLRPSQRKLIVSVVWQALYEPCKSCDKLWYSSFGALNALCFCCRGSRLSPARGCLRSRLYGGPTLRMAMRGGTFQAVRLQRVHESMRHTCPKEIHPQEKLTYSSGLFLPILRRGSEAKYRLSTIGDFTTRTREAARFPSWMLLRGRRR